MMGGVLLALGLCSGIFGALIFAAAKGAIHEIEAFVLFLISAVFFSTAAVLFAFDKMKTTQMEAHARETNRLLSAILENRDKPERALSIFKEG